MYTAEDTTSSAHDTALKAPIWLKLIQANVGLLLFGGGFGMSLPFTLDLAGPQSGSYQISIVHLTIAVLMIGLGILITAASVNDLKANLDLFQRDREHH
jgi:hypothetical protein